MPEPFAVPVVPDLPTVNPDVTPEQSKQFLHDCFVTALEGGIQYWARVNRYHWARRVDVEWDDPQGRLVDDLDGFEALIEDVEWEAETGDSPTWTINAEVIRCGVARLIAGTVKVNNDFRKEIMLGWLTGEAGNIDAWIADCIVQAGLFNEVIYG